MITILDKQTIDLDTGQARYSAGGNGGSEREVEGERARQERERVRERERERERERKRERYAVQWCVSGGEMKSDRKLTEE